MNAVIVDIRRKQAAALDETGRVVRIPNANYEIGQTIELHEVKPVRTPTMLKRLSTGVAAAVLVAMIGTGTAYAMPYGTVTLDGDTSIEYTINCFDYVLDVSAANEAGEALLTEIDAKQLRHQRIDAAVSKTIERMEQRKDAEEEVSELQLQMELPGESHAERLQRELTPFMEREPDQASEQGRPDRSREDAERPPQDETPEMAGNSAHEGTEQQRNEQKPEPEAQMPGDERPTPPDGQQHDEFDNQGGQL